jgi:hypothetical protein
MSGKISIRRRSGSSRGALETSWRSAEPLSVLLASILLIAGAWLTWLGALGDWVSCCADYPYARPTLRCFGPSKRPRQPQRHSARPLQARRTHRLSGPRGRRRSRSRLQRYRNGACPRAGPTEPSAPLIARRSCCRPRGPPPEAMPLGRRRRPLRPAAAVIIGFTALGASRKCVDARIYLHQSEASIIDGGQDY